VPADVEDEVTDLIGIESVAELPGEARRDATAGKKGVKVVFAPSDGDPSWPDKPAEATSSSSKAKPSILRRASGPTGGHDGGGEVSCRIPSVISDAEGLTVAERRTIEARTLRHLVLHDRKNRKCEHCLKGRVRKASVSVTKGRSLDPEQEARLQRPTEFGQCFEADYIIASKQQVGVDEARTSLHIRDHYSGALGEYAAKSRNFNNNVKAMKHFGGRRCIGTSAFCKCDDAAKVKDAAEHLGWIPSPSLPREWPHNTHCERDIGISEDLAGAAFEMSGFPDYAWPIILEYIAQARTFFSDAPIYPYEIGTPHEEAKKGKSRYEVATGHPFTGVEYPIGALVNYRKKASVPGGSRSVPGIFAGWRLEPGLVHRGVVRVIDLEGIKTGKKELFRPLDYRADEVIFPAVADLTFPLRNAKDRSIKLGSDFWQELVGDSSPSGAVEDRKQEPAEREDDQEDDTTEQFRKIVVACDKAKRRNAPITWQRLLDIGPTIGIPGISCPACELTGKDHSQACRDRFNEAYLKIADEEVGKKLDGVTPEKIISSSVSDGSATDR